MKITILAIGKVRSNPADELYHTYIKRLPFPVELKEFEVKKNLPPEKRKEEEATLLMEAVPKGAKVIVLDETGQLPDSARFAEMLKHWQAEGNSSFAFLIGGADGHTEATRKRADKVLSLGKLTWPHLLIRPMLAEQLYRAHTLITGHPYHRG